MRRRIRHGIVAFCALVLAGVPLQAATGATTGATSETVTTTARTTAAYAVARLQDGPTADELRARVETCGTQLSNGMYAERSGGPRTVPVCGKSGAVFWKSGMTIDCDGQRTAECNENTDPWFQPQTSCTQSDGRYLNSSALPFIVTPIRSSIWDYSDHDIDCGTVVAVVYQDRVVYGVVGDRGPSDAAGEGSYRLAAERGINPDPRVGGVSGRVVDYIFFPGTEAQPIEDHDDATARGTQAATAFVNADPTCDDVGLNFSSYEPIGTGDSGALVRAAQCRLRTAGHDPGGFGGEFDDATAAAVEAFQSVVGLAATGSVDSHTWTALLAHGGTPLLRNGSTGEGVLRLQRALTAALSRDLGIDGQFGPITEQAVRDYQGSRSLGVDGIVGAQTWGALQSGQ